MNPIGTILKHLRIAAKIKQKDMAARLNISSTYLSMIESNAREASVELLNKYADALGVPIEFLMLQARDPKNFTTDQMKVFDQIRTLLFEFQRHVTSQEHKKHKRIQQKQK